MTSPKPPTHAVPRDGKDTRKARPGKESATASPFVDPPTFSESERAEALARGHMAMHRAIRRADR